MDSPIFQEVIFPALIPGFLLFCLSWISGSILRSIAPVDPAPRSGFYTPDRIDQQLDLATRNFVNNDLLVFPSQLKVSLSKIFHWYQADFGSKKDLLLFLAGNLANQDLGNWIRENQDRIQIQYQPYNWDLNVQSDI